MNRVNVRFQAPLHFALCSHRSQEKVTFPWIDLMCVFRSSIIFRVRGGIISSSLLGFNKFYRLDDEDVDDYNDFKNEDFFGDDKNSLIEDYRVAEDDTDYFKDHSTCV